MHGLRPVKGRNWSLKNRVQTRRRISASEMQCTNRSVPFCRQLTAQKIDPCQVAAWPGEACDETESDRIVGDNEDDGDGLGCRLGCQGRSETCGRDDHGNLPANQVSRQLWQPIHLILCPAVFDRCVLPLDEACVP